jgi:DNA helicase-2/ATP-dependent DNA helicase PcrA
MTDLAKHVLIDTGLSVTALNHFLECPNKFLYESILKLPQAPSASAEKGTAMHEAISAIWRSSATWQSKSKNAKDIEKIIAAEVSAYLAESFLSASEKAAVKKELLENAPIVAQALESHFNVKVKARVLTESFVKTTFQGSFKESVKGSAKESAKDEPVTIPIHGKLDAIVDTGLAVNVFDYKTRQSMSVAQIKGQTKNSTGDYFRQLVFYKLLLRDDPRFRTKKINTALVFVSPDKKDRCPIIELEATEVDITTIKRQIQSVIDSVWSGAIATATCSDENCQYCRLNLLNRKFSCFLKGLSD